MELTLDQALQKGIEAHKAGRLQEADRYYTAILKANPKHPDANHNMGVLAVDVGKVQEALSFFKKALEANTSNAQFWLSYIDALIKLERLAEAKAVFYEAKTNGAKGHRFNELKAFFIRYETVAEVNLTSQTPLEPTKKQVQTLINLHTQGQYQEVQISASELLKHFPNSINLYNIIGTSNMGLGKLDKAIEAYTKALSIKPDYAEAYNNMGIALQNQGKLKEATEAYTKALSAKPDFAEAHNNMGLVLQDQSKLDEALEAYTKALSAKPDFAEAYYNMGNAFKTQGKLDKAIDAYAKAITFNRKHFEAYNNMGNALQAQGKLEEAIGSYTKALSLNDRHVGAYNNIASVLQDQGKLDKAIEAYKKALLIQPRNADAWYNGAETLEKWNKLEQLEIWLNKGFNSFETVPADLIFIKCKLLWRKKNFEEMSSLISDIQVEDISRSRQHEYFNLKAKWFEKSGDFKKAFDCYEKCNSLVKKSKEYLKLDPDAYFQKLADESNKIKLKSLINSTFHPITKSGFSPTFLVGFPRSGTTLLDTILRSHSKISVVEEQPMLLLTESYLNNKGYNDFRVELISSKVVSEAQKIYSREFVKYIKTSSIDSACIDKLPLNLLKAPLINQLYPDAKFLLALRHPMDTIFSCWIQNFKLNEAMANMVDLDRIVDFYCIAMDSFKISRAEYNLNVQEIRYEDLINDFHDESKAVLKFLNLKWEPEMENYQDTAMKRGRIKTPSYSQVVQPIYKDSQYRWLNYRKYLEQYLAQVKPWISEFGYD